MPSSDSMPTDPYLNCSSTLSNGAVCGDLRPVVAHARSSAHHSTPSARRRTDGDLEDIGLPGSERFQVLEKIFTLARRQRGPVAVSGVAVASQAGVEAHALRFGFGPAGHEPDVGPVVDVVAAVERCRTLVWKKESAQRRHRPVVQVWRAQPEAV